MVRHELGSEVKKRNSRIALGATVANHSLIQVGSGSDAVTVDVQTESSVIDDTKVGDTGGVSRVGTG